MFRQNTHIVFQNKILCRRPRSNFTWAVRWSKLFVKKKNERFVYALPNLYKTTVIDTVIKYNETADVLIVLLIIIDASTFYVKTNK